MPDALSAIGDAVGTVAGPLVSGGLNLAGGLMQLGGQQQSVQQQEQFQSMMSSSAYQRAVADMKDAGLNPALMYGSGGPESTPSGASVTPPNVLGDVGNAVTGTAGADETQRVQSAEIALKHLEALTNTAKLPLFQAEGDFVKSLTPAMHSLEKFLSTSASGINSLGKVTDQGVNSAFNLLGEGVSGFSREMAQPGSSDVAINLNDVP